MSEVADKAENICPPNSEDDTEDDTSGESFDENILNGTMDLMGIVGNMVGFSRFSSNIELKRASPGSAAYDIRSREKVCIPPESKVQIKTGLKIDLLPGFYFKLETKSRHAIHGGVMIVDGKHIPFEDIKKQNSPEVVAEMMEKYNVYTKHGLSVVGGIIDSDYKNEIFVCLWNHSKTENFYVEPGDAVAQGIIMANFLFCNEVKLDGERRVGGFGSTGN